MANRSRGIRRLRLGALLVLAAAALTPACGDHEPALPAAPAEHPAAEPAPIGGTRTACTSWGTRQCGLEIGTHDGVVQCARGKQTCENERWGACIPDATLGTLFVPLPRARGAPGGHLGLQAIGGSATVCADNPCDPTCHIFADAPDAAFTSPVTDAGPVLQGGSLGSSNVPTGFQDKGSDPDGVCTPGCATAACEAACQYDQHCSPTAADTCVEYELGESNACIGVDVTARVSCSSADGTERIIAVCNRGTTDAPPGIDCWAFPGNSQQMPSTNPDTSNATWIGATTATLGAGECESVRMPESRFGSSGIKEVVCNVAGWRESTVSVGPLFPTSHTSGLSTELDWSTEGAAYATGAPHATALLLDASGSASDVKPSANASVGSDAAWSNPDRGYAPDLAYATAAPGLPTVTSASLAANPTTDTASLGADSYQADGTYGDTTVASRGGTSSIDFSGFQLGDQLPATAVVTSVDIQVVWKVDSANHRVSSAVRAYTGTTAVTTSSQVSFTSGTAPSTAYTQNVTGITTLTASQLRRADFTLRSTFTNDDNGNGTLTASVDSVTVTAHYTAGGRTASVAYSGFSIAAPAAATVSQLAVQATWRASAATPDAELRFVVHTPSGVVAGGEYVEAAPGTAAVTRTLTLTNPAIVGSDLSNLRVVVHASRLGDTAFVAYLDSVQVAATWSGTSADRGVFYDGFAFSIPAGATLTNVTSTAAWQLSSSPPSATLGLQAYRDGTALGTETTDATSPTSLRTVSQTLSGAALGALTPADLNGGRLKVHVGVGR